MKNTFLISSVLSLTIWAIAAFALSVHLDRAVLGHLKLAADANSTDLASQRLQTAVDGMDTLGLCNSGGGRCFTSIVYTTPEEDVGYWRHNIELTLADLEAMTPEDRADNLVESNQLMKVRETLLDSGQNGDKVTAPSGLSRYPSNMAMGLWLLLSCIAILIGLIEVDRRRF